MTREENINYLLLKGTHLAINNIDELSDNKLNEIVEANKYPNRRKDGLDFSDVMNARLNILVAPDSVKDVIDSHFAQTQFFLEGGKWKSAHREVTKLQPIPHPLDGSQFIVSQELINEIIASIAGYIQSSYN